MAQFYKHSGRTSFWGVPAALLGGVAAGSILAVPYSYILVWIPIAYISFLLPIFYGLAVGWAAFAVAKAGKVRSTGAASLAGFLSSAGGLFVCWAVDMPARLGMLDLEGASFTLHPGALLEYMGHMLDIGSWSMFGFTPTGFFLAVIWLIEAGMIVIIATLTAGGKMMSTVYCEGCGNWAEKEEVPHKLSGAEAFAIVESLKAGMAADLVKRTRSHDDATVVLRFDLQHCTGCTETHYLTVRRVTITRDKKGKESENEEELLDLLKISASDVDHVRNAGTQGPVEEAPSTPVNASQEIKKDEEEADPVPEDPGAPRVHFPWASFFVGIALAGGLLTLTANSVPGWNQNPFEPRWEAFQSTEGRFKVELPGPASSGYQDLNFPDPSLEMSIHEAAIFGRGSFGVGYVDLPEKFLAEVEEPEEFLDRFSSAEARSAGEKLLAKGDVTLAGRPGRNAVYITEDGARIEARLCLAGTRLYMVIVTQLGGDYDEEAAHRVFESFSILE